MSLSRQSLLGLAMLFGGSVMLFAMVQQIKTPDEPEVQSVELTTETGEPVNTELRVEPLTTDAKTEASILATKEQQREARAKQQEAKTEAFIKEQEQAEARALANATAENEAYKTEAEPINDIETESTVNAIAQPKAETREEELVARAEQAKAEKAKQEAAKKVADEKKAADKKAAEALAAKKAAEKKAAEQKAKAEAEAKKAATAKAQAEQVKAAPKKTGNYTVKSGDSLSVLAERYNVPLSALAQANGLSTTSNLQVGQTLKFPSAARIEQLKKDAAYLETKRKMAAEKEAKQKAASQSAQQKLQEARKTASAEGAKGTFGVQVALASDEEKAAEVVQKFRSAGYQVKTSQTSKGVRIIVGPERGKEAALALKDKINNDSRVDTNGAWVLYWR